LVQYTLTDADVKGPFVPNIPPKMEDMAKLPNLGYRNSIERLAAKFHMDEKLLKSLNPGKSLSHAGERTDNDLGRQCPAKLPGIVVL
jgi:hypothetical protein